MLSNLGLECKTYLSKRLWAVGLLFVLLAAIALVQYDWIGQAAEAERQRARTRLTAALSEFATDFDIEITRAFAAFSLPDPTGDGYLSRYQEWKRLAPYPGLICGAYVLEPGRDGPSLKALAPGSPAIDPTAWQRDLKPLLSAPSAPIASFSEGGFSAVARAGVVRTASARFGGSIAFTVGPAIAISGNPAFVFPAPAAPVTPGEGSVPPLLPPERWVVVVLDADYIRTALLPKLAQLHFGTGPAADYDLLVVAKARADATERTIFFSGPAGHWSFAHPDGSIGLFQIRMDCFSPPPDPGGSGPDTLGVVTRAFAFDRQPGPSRSRPRSQVFLRAPAEVRVSGFGNLAEILAQRPASCISRGAAPEGEWGQWQLLVRYRAGSLDQVIAGFRRRNLLLSGGVLLVLAGGVLMLIISAERARALAEMHAEFALGVSHELRTPLSVIRVAADNLQRGMVETSEQAQRYGLIIGTKTSELSNMIEETLLLARVQSPTGSRETAAASVEQAVKACLERGESVLRDASMHVEVDLPPDLPQVGLNARLLESCLDNLIQNVVRYADAGRWIGIQARKVGRREGERVQISVTDRGPGIARDELPHVFESFYRSRRGEASRTPGVGLGLTLVKRIVEAHQGAVEVESSDRGTRFSLVLPVSLASGPGRNARPIVTNEPPDTSR